MGTNRSVRVGDVANSGNLSFGDNNTQTQILSGEGSLADRIQQLVEQMRHELRESAGLPGRPAAEEALTEIDEAITDGPVPSRPQRLDRASRKLIRALKGVTEFAAPLAQLAAAIAQLVQAKP